MGMKKTCRRVADASHVVEREQCRGSTVDTGDEGAQPYRTTAKANRTKTEESMQEDRHSPDLFILERGEGKK